MKVSIVVGGRWHAFDLAAQLHRQGALHRLVTNYPRFVTRRWGLPDENVVSMPGSQVAGRLMARLSAQAAARSQYVIHRWFAHSAPRHLDGSDLLVCWSSFAEPALEWAAKRSIPSVLERGSAHILQQGDLLRDEYRALGLAWRGIHPGIEAMELREYGQSHKICVPSRFVEESFVSRDIPADRLFLNRYGVDLSVFRPPVEPPAPPSPDRLEIVFAGALSVQKGVVHLLRAFEAARQPGWRLRLLGAVTEEARSWVRPVPTGVNVLGARPQAELPAHYGRAHCFVMPSIQEGMAMVQVQALACGLPLICTQHTGGEDLLRLGGHAGIERGAAVVEYPAGFVVPIRRPDSIAWCMQELATHPSLWAEKRAAALAIAAGALGWDHYGQRAMNLYQALLGGRGHQ